MKRYKLIAVFLLLNIAGFGINNFYKMSIPSGWECLGKDLFEKLNNDEMKWYTQTYKSPRRNESIALFEINTFITDKSVLELKNMFLIGGKVLSEENIKINNILYTKYSVELTVFDSIKNKNSIFQNIFWFCEVGKQKYMIRYGSNETETFDYYKNDAFEFIKSIQYEKR